MVLTLSVEALFTKSLISLGSSVVPGEWFEVLIGALLGGPCTEGGALLGGPCEAGALLGGP